MTVMGMQILHKWAWILETRSEKIQCNGYNFGGQV